MKRWISIFLLCAGVVAAARAQEAAKAFDSFSPKHVISQYLTYQSEQKPWIIRQLIGKQWCKMAAWFSESWQTKEAFQNWVEQNPQDYWALIEGFDYLGQYQCFWKLFLNTDIMPMAINLTCLQAIMNFISRERIEMFVQQYFGQIKQDILQEGVAGRDLQVSEWTFPLGVLLQYKFDVFVWFINQESQLRELFLGQDYLYCLIRLAKKSPDVVFGWIRNSWQDFELVLKKCCYKSELWQLMTLAPEEWLTSHLAKIAQITLCYPELLNDLDLFNSLELNSFFDQHSDFFMNLCDKFPEIVRILFQHYPQRGQYKARFSIFLCNLANQKPELHTQLLQIYLQMQS